MKAFLMLQDGTRFYGQAFGDVKNIVGEVVFSTSIQDSQNKKVLKSSRL